MDQDVVNTAAAAGVRKSSRLAGLAQVTSEQSRSAPALSTTQTTKKRARDDGDDQGDSQNGNEVAVAVVKRRNYNHKSYKDRHEVCTLLVSL